MNCSEAVAVWAVAVSDVFSAGAPAVGAAGAGETVVSSAHRDVAVRKIPAQRTVRKIEVIFMMIDQAGENQ